MTRSQLARAAALALALCAVLASTGTAAKPRNKTQSVVVIVIDGVRYSESFGDPKRANVPHLAKDLAPLGAFYTNFRNEGATKTNPGHVALVTGRYEAVANNGKQLSSAPTITQLFLKSARSRSTAASVIVSKDKLHILSNSTGPEWKDKYVATTSAGKKGFGTGYRSDKDTFKETLKILKRDHPRLVVINFAGPDSAGHAKRWDAYLGAIRECDRYTWEIWRALESDPFYAGKTTLLVTNDHGRHDDKHGGFRNHGCSCEGCRRLTLVAVGPDFARGKIITEPAEQIDLAPTVGVLLGFDVPEAEGRTLLELFKKSPTASASEAGATRLPDNVRAQQIKDMKWGMFVCWSFSSFYGQEWTPTRGKDASFFKATGCDTDQWCKTAVDAGMGYILFLAKHHDGFCLWDTKTSEKKVTNSPLGIDVLAALRKSCDKYGVRLALYWSEGDWNWPGAVDGKRNGGRNPEVKKAQLKELLTQYGPVEFWWMDHAIGTGGLSHKDTVEWIHRFQPNSFVGFNHGQPAGRLCLRERGRPGNIGDRGASKYNAGAESSFKGYHVAEFTYPILPKHRGGAQWFYSLPKHDNLCHPASKIYGD
ncbi:MAG: alpha-L-fucosidase, partial [Planctomycetota bacterium]